MTWMAYYLAWWIVYISVATFVFYALVVHGDDRTTTS